MFSVEPVYEIGAPADGELSTFVASKIVNYWGSHEEQVAAYLAHKNGIAICRTSYVHFDGKNHDGKHHAEIDHDGKHYAEIDPTVYPNVRIPTFTRDYVFYPAVAKLQELGILDEVRATGTIVKDESSGNWEIPRIKYYEIVPVILWAISKEVPDNPLDLIAPLNRSEEVMRVHNAIANPKSTLEVFSSVTLGVNLSKDYPGVFCINSRR